MAEDYRHRPPLSREVVMIFPSLMLPPVPPPPGKGKAMPMRLLPVFKEGAVMRAISSHPQKKMPRIENPNSNLPMQLEPRIRVIILHHGDFL